MYSLTKFLKFIPTAQAAATYSKDPSTKVGAIAIDDDYNIRAQGYNGFPRGVKDTEVRLNEREQKYPRIVHAEANLVAMAARTGASLQGCSVLLTSLHPCSTCAGLLIQAGIKRVFAPKQVSNGRWDTSSAVALEMFEEAGVELIHYDADGTIVTEGAEKRKEWEGIQPEPFTGASIEDVLKLSRSSITQNGPNNFALNLEALVDRDGNVEYWGPNHIQGELLIEKIHSDLVTDMEEIGSGLFVETVTYNGTEYLREGRLNSETEKISWGPWTALPKLFRKPSDDKETRLPSKSGTTEEAKTEPRKFVNNEEFKRYLEQLSADIDKTIHALITMTVKKESSRV